MKDRLSSNQISLNPTQLAKIQKIPSSCKKDVDVHVFGSKIIWYIKGPRNFILGMFILGFYLFVNSLFNLFREKGFIYLVWLIIGGFLLLIGGILLPEINSFQLDFFKSIIILKKNKIPLSEITEIQLVYSEYKDSLKDPKNIKLTYEIYGLLIKGQKLNQCELCFNYHGTNLSQFSDFGIYLAEVLTELSKHTIPFKDILREEATERALYFKYLVKARQIPEFSPSRQAYRWVSEKGIEKLELTSNQFNKHIQNKQISSEILAAFLAFPQTYRKKFEINLGSTFIEFKGIRASKYYAIILGLLTLVLIALAVVFNIFLENEELSIAFLGLNIPTVLFGIIFFIQHRNLQNNRFGVDLKLEKIYTSDLEIKFNQISRIQMIHDLCTEFDEDKHPSYHHVYGLRLEGEGNQIFTVLFSAMTSKLEMWLEVGYYFTQILSYFCKRPIEFITEPLDYHPSGDIIYFDLY